MLHRISAFLRHDGIILLPHAHHFIVQPVKLPELVLVLSIILLWPSRAWSSKGVAVKLDFFFVPSYTTEPITQKHYVYHAVEWQQSAYALKAP